jgi:hypothetical protein
MDRKSVCQGIGGIPRCGAAPARRLRRTAASRTTGFQSGSAGANAEPDDEVLRQERRGRKLGNRFDTVSTRSLGEWTHPGGVDGANSN